MHTLTLTGLQLNRLQEDDLGGVQVHILDGVRTPHVGPGLGASLRWPCCVLCSKTVYQWAPSKKLGALLLDGGHPGPGWLVDGQEWLAGGLNPVATCTSWQWRSPA